jgi:hypothetical protein
MPADQAQEGHPEDEATASQADDRELAPGHQLVGEGPGDPEQLARLSDRVDETLAVCGMWRAWTAACALDVHANVHANVHRCVHTWDFPKNLGP